MVCLLCWGKKGLKNSKIPTTGTSSCLLDTVLESWSMAEPEAWGCAYNWIGLVALRVLL